MYGAQTGETIQRVDVLFENDVEMYGAQTTNSFFAPLSSLRMM